MNTTEQVHKQTHTRGQLIVDKGTKVSQWRKKSLFNKQCPNQNMGEKKNQLQPLHYALQLTENGL